MQLKTKKIFIEDYDEFIKYSYYDFVWALMCHRIRFKIESAQGIERRSREIRV